MRTNVKSGSTDRRQFLGALATGAATLGLTAVTPPLQAIAAASPAMVPGNTSNDDIFSKITGKKRIVFDATQPHEMMPFAWPRVFLLTNEMTGTHQGECSVVVVLRHSAIGYAMEDRLWSKYSFGELFKANDPETGKPATRNPFWQPKPGAFKVPGLGEVMIGINQLQESGVMFCVCEMAITVYSAAAAGMMKLDAKEVRADFMSGILPGIQPVPSGVWALGEAQEKGCGYIFAG